MKITRETSLSKHFKSLPDPRIERTKRHLLTDILTIALVAVMCGAKGFNEIEDFGVGRRDFFSKFLELPNPA